MGASGWSYFVPYDPDPNKALRALREQEFRAGRYHVPEPFALVEFPSFENFVPEQWILDDPDEREHWLASYEREKKRAARAKKGNPTFESIEDLLEFCAEDGTHSILDIPRVGNSTSLQDSGSIPDERLREIFVTTRPTRAMVEANAHALLTARRRGYCTYVVVYAGDEPAELFFTGFSGD